MKSILYFFTALLFFSFQAQAQELLPFVENYSKSNYQGDNQVWNVVQGKDNAMYFANNHYLLRYNGVVWEKYNLPNKTIIRSVLVDGNKVYSGSYQEFGYWIRENGKMIYSSITKNKGVFDDKDNEEIWKIFKFNDAIYFQSFNAVYVYNGKKIKKLKIPFLISYCFVTNGKIFVASVEKGVFDLNSNGTLKPIKNWDVLKNTVIHGIETYGSKIFVFTQKKGVYVYQNGKLESWNSSLNSVLANATINTARFIKNNQLVIGTGNKGLYIYNLKTNTYKSIKRDNVLLNNSILCIAFDNEDDLWLGLDNGIAHVEVNSPVSIFYDNSGVLGSVYSVASIENGYLIASNHGLFEYESGGFSLLRNTQGQAWDITKVNTQLVIGHNSGTFLYKNGNLSKINNLNGGWNFTKSNIDNSHFQANYSGVSIYNNPDNLSESIKIDGLAKPIKYVAQSKKNEIWAADNYRGLYRIIYDDNFRIEKIENTTHLSGITKDFGVKIFEFRKEVLFLIDNVWYNYNYISNKLEKNKLFNSNFKNVTDAVAINDNHFIVLKDGILFHIDANANKFGWNLIQEKYYNGKLINDNLKIFKDRNNYLLNLDDGFISLQLKKNIKKSLKVIVEGFSNGKILDNSKKIPFSSELKLNVITGVYGALQPNLFYKINESKQYFPVKKGSIILNNLTNGSQEITIFNNDGTSYIKLANYSFQVAKPWYYSFWMILLYIILIGIVLFLYYKWNKLRYIQKLKLQEEELKHQKEILEMELKAEHELNTQEYEKHILELELQTKSSEVAGKSLSIAKQSEMIENIQTILNNESDINKLKSEVKKAIKINAVNKHEWETFETNLNQIHNEFIVKLSQKYPNLTSKDIKLCIYLKMNLSSKEIAPLMNISFRGVELHRYRLRKKLQLSTEDSLSQFLLTL